MTLLERQTERAVQQEVRDVFQRAALYNDMRHLLLNHPRISFLFHEGPSEEWYILSRDVGTHGQRVGPYATFGLMFVDFLDLVLRRKVFVYGEGGAELRDSEGEDDD